MDPAGPLLSECRSSCRWPPPHAVARRRRGCTTEQVAREHELSAVCATSRGSNVTGSSVPVWIVIPANLLLIAADALAVYRSAPLEERNNG
jgi:hypothetical protein